MSTAGSDATQHTIESVSLDDLSSVPLVVSVPIEFAPTITLKRQSRSRALVKLATDRDSDDSTIDELLNLASALSRRLNVDVIVNLHQKLELNDFQTQRDPARQLLYFDPFLKSTFIFALDCMPHSLRKPLIDVSSLRCDSATGDELLADYWSRADALAVASESESSSSSAAEEAAWFAFNAPLLYLVRSVLLSYDDRMLALALLNHNTRALATATATATTCELYIARVPERVGKVRDADEAMRDIWFPELFIRTAFHETKATDAAAPLRPFHDSVELRGGADCEEVDADRTAAEIVERVFHFTEPEHFCIRQLQRVLPHHRIDVVQCEDGARVKFSLIAQDLRCSLRFKVSMAALQTVQSRDGALLATDVQFERDLPAADERVRCDYRWDDQPRSANAVVRDLVYDAATKQARIFLNSLQHDAAPGFLRDGFVTMPRDPVTVLRAQLVKGDAVTIETACQPRDRRARVLALFLLLRNAVADRLNLDTIIDDVAISSSGRSTTTDLHAVVRRVLTENPNARLLPTLRGELADVGFYRAFGFRYFNATCADTRTTSASEFMDIMLQLLWRVDVGRGQAIYVHRAPNSAGGERDFVDVCLSFQRLVAASGADDDDRDDMMRARRRMLSDSRK